MVIYCSIAKEITIDIESERSTISRYHLYMFYFQLTLIIVRIYIYIYLLSNIGHRISSEYINVAPKTGNWMVEESTNFDIKHVL